MDAKVGGKTGIDWAALDKAAAIEKKKLAKVSNYMVPYYSCPGRVLQYY
jgi:hypothetical protein